MISVSIKQTAIAVITAIAVSGASVQASSAMPLDTLHLKTAAPAVQTVGWTTKQKQAAGWGLAGGILAGALIAGAVNKKKKNNAANMHIAYCAGKYQTYNPATNMYMSYSGPKYCYSPYM